MANVEHSTLTGSALHEPKGVAAAAANRVYVSNGAASGSWTQVPNAALATEAKAFQGGLFHAYDIKPNGTDGGTFSTGALRTRTLNTVLTNEIPGASLSLNQITLPAGTYWIEASAPAYQVEGHQVTWRNITDSVSLIRGTSERCMDALDVNTRSSLSGRFTIGATKVFELQHGSNRTETGHGFGKAAFIGTDEIYSVVKIWKVG